MKKDYDYLYELMNKSTEAISNLNEKVFKQLKETIQIIFEQINSHPIFTKLDLVKDTYRNNNCLTINVYGSNEVRANAPYVFSSAQVNSIALSVFLALVLKQKWSSLQLVGMDDPIQSMDEVNIISFIDLMRLFVDKHKKQIIISTHDQSFYKMILKKFRYFNLKTIEYEAYGDKGPTIKKHNEEIPNDKIKLELNYEQARDSLLQLDKNE
jgi:ABC-type lipoprotein export system ATPase subunit